MFRTCRGWASPPKTPPQTKQLLRQAIEMHIAGMREDGLPIPKPQTQVMRLAVPA
jgi:predicted RNase H-like HicB family nuclease